MTTSALSVFALPKVDTNIPEWRADAECRWHATEMFYPPSSKSGAPPSQAVLDWEDQAKAVCGRCTVRATCLAWAMETAERYGVWGGMTERERRSLRRRQARRGVGVAS